MRSRAHDIRDGEGMLARVEKAMVAWPRHRAADDMRLMLPCSGLFSDGHMICCVLKKKISRIRISLSAPEF